MLNIQLSKLISVKLTIIITNKIKKNNKYTLIIFGLVGLFLLAPNDHMCILIGGKIC